ncbi:MAG: TonB-dependent receptor [Xanthomonadales bacterium]|nr:TonB-dependent receptor [Xanthomonadales bacterium]
MDEIVVTATRLKTTLQVTARSISVVDQQQIQDGMQQLSLDESLVGVPGLYMQNRYNMAQDLRVSLRGFGARSAFGIRGIKIIVDGIPETLPDGQAGVDSIDLGSARRIQVLRGPSSSLYGNASGGVILIDSQLGEEPAFVETNLAAGGLGFQKYQLKAGGTSGNFDYLVNAASQHLDGYREHSASKGTLINGRFGIQLNENDSLIFVVNSTDQPKAQDPGGISAAQVALDRRSARLANLVYDAGEALDQQRLGIVYDRERPAGSLMLRNYYVWRDFSNQLPFQNGGAVDLDRLFYGGGAQYTFGNVIPEPLQLMLGVDLDRQNDHRKRFDNLQGEIGPLTLDQKEQVDSNGVFVQSQYHLNERWDLSAGLRYDKIKFDVTDRYLADGDDSGKVDFDHTSFSVGLNRNFGDGVLFATVGNSFETPTTTELANPDGSGGFNQTLEPQTAVNYEIGFKAGTETLYYEIAVFHINLEDELVPYELPGSPGRTFYSNAGKSSRTGIETAVSWTGSGGFGIDASMTWSDFKFDEFVDNNGRDFSGSRMPGVPEYFAYLGLRYQNNKGFKITFETSYSGNLFANNANTVEVSDYLVSSLRATYDIQTTRLMFRPYVGINNLFNEYYNSNIRINAFGGRYYEPAPERNVYAGIVIRYQ